MIFAGAKGELPEWSNGADSKSVVPFLGTGGSNPSLSAISHKARVAR